MVEEAHGTLVVEACVDPDCDPHTVVVVMVGLGLHRARFEVLPRGFCMRILLTYNASATASLLFTGGGGVLTAHMPTTTTILASAVMANFRLSFVVCFGDLVVGPAVKNKKIPFTY